MLILRKLILRTLFFAGFFVVIPSHSFAQDIYIVYAGTDKNIQKELKSVLSENFKVKSFNVGLLAMADYTGKQKAITKISKAKVVVLINEKPAELLGDAEFASVVTVSSSSRSAIDAILVGL